MRGLWLDASGARLRDDLAPPLEGPDEVLVDVLCAGVCATDLALGRGYMDFEGVPGHEFVGRARTGRLAGQRVVGEINAGCGTCELCRNGDPRHCASRTVLGILGRPGAFAETMSLPEANLYPVPESVPDEAAVFTEPLAAACALLEALPDLVHGTPAVVVGDGRLGLLCALVLQRAGALVTVLGRHPERVERLPSLRWGTARPGQRWPIVVEATGAVDGPQRALDLVEVKGTLLLKTTMEAPAALDLARLVVDEIRLVGSRCGRFQDALDLLASGAVDPTPLLDAELLLDQAPEALARAAQPGTLKVLIRNAAAAPS